MQSICCIKIMKLCQQWTNLPTSKAGDAIGDNSTLMNRTPSDGRTALGDVISQDTCARTLKVIRARDQGKSKIIIFCSMWDFFPWLNLIFYYLCQLKKNITFNLYSWPLSPDLLLPVICYHQSSKKSKIFVIKVW